MAAAHLEHLEHLEHVVTLDPSRQGPVLADDVQPEHRTGEPGATTSTRADHHLTWRHASDRPGGLAVAITCTAPAGSLCRTAVSDEIANELSWCAAAEALARDPATLLTAYDGPDAGPLRDAPIDLVHLAGLWFWTYTP